MVPRNQPVVTSITRWQPSTLQAGGWMIGCWKMAVMIVCQLRKGQSKLMGSICYTWIPFILIAINQSYLSPLSDLYSANPLKDPKTHHNTDAVVLFSLSWWSWPPMLMNPCSMFRFSLSQSHLITPSFCDYDDSAYCQPHSGSTAYTLFIVISMTVREGVLLSVWSFLCAGV